MAKFQTVVAPPDAGRRLDRYVQGLLGCVPSSLVQRLLRQGKVRLNGRRGRPGDRLGSGDRVEIDHVPRPGDRALVPPDAPQFPAGRPAGTATAGPAALGIVPLFRDALYLVVSKPAGVPCHATGPAPESVLAWARGFLSPEIEAASVRPSLAHRIDAGTSGLVVVALTAAAVARFHQQLAAGRVEKSYLAAVWGRPPADTLRLDLPLQRREGVPRDRPKMRAVPVGGQRALTLCQVLARADDASLLRAVPVTGRTHQIRAHLRAAGFPIVGDPRYGDPVRDREAGIRLHLAHQLLHAGRLAFDAADAQVIVTAPLPADAQQVLALLGLPVVGPAGT